MAGLSIAPVAEPHEKGAMGPQASPAGASGIAFFATALLLLTIGAALRIYHLGNRSLWYDEAVTANISRGTFAQVLEKTWGVSAPVVHPYILYFIEKVWNGASAVRSFSALASFLAILMMLAMVRAKVSRMAALVAAAILAVSATQIRYAQEVREYSLTVLFAAVLIYCVLRWEAAESSRRHPLLLFAVLFLAPLVQYGLVFFGAAVLTTIVLRLWLAPETRFKFADAVLGSISLAAGALLSFLLTLRYQMRLGSRPWYLASYYFDPKTTHLVGFLSQNSQGLLTFFVSGQLVIVSLLIGGVLLCDAQLRKRKADTLTLLVGTSIAITAFAAILKLYPYGGVRQCLFLAPGIALFGGVAFVEILQRLEKSWRPVATAAFLLLVLFSGYRELVHSSPYAEYEDTQSILKELAKSSAPNDQVWVHHDAVPAFLFYQPKKDPRFIYGTYHADPGQYMPDLLGSLDPRTDRLWLVFSHLQQQSDHAEEQLIIASLREDWDVRSVIAPANTQLFVADRKSAFSADRSHRANAKKSEG